MCYPTTFSARSTASRSHHSQNLDCSLNLKWENGCNRCDYGNLSLLPLFKVLHAAHHNAYLTPRHCDLGRDSESFWNLQCALRLSESPLPLAGCKQQAARMVAP